MKSTLVTVLYEDQLSGAKPANYGPHCLLLACPADRLGADRWLLRARVEGIPKKGSSKLRTALLQDGAMLAERGKLVALFDNDRVRACFGVAADLCRPALLDIIRQQTPSCYAVVLLEQNLEDLVVACCQALSRNPPLSKPGPEERDRILHAAASAERSVRENILRVVPSFERLVARVHEALKSLDEE